MMKIPLFIYAVIYFTGRNRHAHEDYDINNDIGAATIAAKLGCFEDMGEVDTILSLLQQDQESPNQAKTYVITGATSGIGLDAAKILAMMNPENRIFVVGRNERKARMAAREVISVLQQPRKHRENIIPIACDHSNLDSVRRFAIQLKQKLIETYDPNKWEKNGVDVLCLNAAVLRPNNIPAQFTRDNIEITFQTNHISPFLLVNLIHEQLNAGGRVVVSTSGLFLYQKFVLEGMLDPNTGRARKRFETADGSQYNCKQSYAFSKLCNVAMAVELQERLLSRDIAIISFSPGLITQTGLFRYHRGNHPIKFPRNLMQNEKSVIWGAGALVYVATSQKVGQSRGTYWHDPGSGRGPCAIYGKDFGPSEISDSHIDPDKRKRLWSLSCELSGIPEYMIPLPEEKPLAESERVLRLPSFVRAN